MSRHPRRGGGGGGGKPRRRSRHSRTHPRRYSRRKSAARRPVSAAVVAAAADGWCSDGETWRCVRGTTDTRRKTRHGTRGDGCPAGRANYSIYYLSSASRAAKPATELYTYNESFSRFVRTPRGASLLPTRPQRGSRVAERAFSSFSTGFGAIRRGSRCHKRTGAWPRTACDYFGEHGPRGLGARTLVCNRWLLLKCANTRGRLLPCSSFIDDRERRPVIV